MTIALKVNILVHLFTTKQFLVSCVRRNDVGGKYEHL